ncbi:replication protein [Streptococcus suis]|uniref:replication protein n=1 Tax=Streptococcus suis TaxID=1307 RepID=UPI0019608321|nr:replication protein [Streptococcus suis]MBM7284931.1 replication protein [Streptococcus suis]MCO8236976.1 replication protein [Streptococcus suis]HEM3533493.1 replication protein [Streptococcus suis]
MERLSKRQENFLSNLLLTGNVAKASELSNIKRDTGYRYLKDATFKRVYRELKSEQLKETTALLQIASVEAVEVLREVMKDKRASPYARVQASNTVLQMAYKAVETVEVVEQLEMLEAQIKHE